MSGPIGETILPAVRAVQIWAGKINQGGGLNGHPVRLLLYDDGGDPARHRAQVQEAIEVKHAIAFVQNLETITGQASVEYITAKRVPVIGSIGPETWYYDSPMYFPQQSTGQYFLLSTIKSVAEQVLPRGKTKIAWLVCAEVEQICGTADRAWAADAPKLGLQVVNRGKASVAQPDFTAECLTARNAGAEVFLIAMDTNSLQRIGSACARQGYRPQFATTASIVQERLTQDSVFDGMIANTNVFPYFQPDTRGHR